MLHSVYDLPPCTQLLIVAVHMQLTILYCAEQSALARPNSLCALPGGFCEWCTYSTDSNCIGATFGCAVRPQLPAVVVLRVLGATDGHSPMLSAVLRAPRCSLAQRCSACCGACDAVVKAISLVCVCCSNERNWGESAGLSTERVTFGFLDPCESEVLLLSAKLSWSQNRRVFVGMIGR